VTADRSTVETWLRKLEKAADEHDGDTYRAWVFREVIAEAWADGHGRGYDDSRDDHDRAAATARRAAREAGAGQAAAKER
jgi:hypothetical protein